MLSDNIRNNRKKINLSQDELAEKLGVSRQSVSFWETGQTQPTIDNIIALAKVFNISSDMLLGNVDSVNTPQDNTAEYAEPKKKSKIGLIITIIVLTILIIGVGIFAFYSRDKHSKTNNGSNDTANNSVIQSEASATNGYKPESTASTTTSKAPTTQSTTPSNENSAAADTPSTPTEAQFDLFDYCKNLAIKIGKLNGDYCIYQQPATKYGGYDNEYFSISYWSDSDMVEFCLHCPLSDTLSHNFYLRMRGGYNKKYEYLSSKYYRDNGESLRSATGYIDPLVFTDSYPISCDEYQGDTDGQTQFMEDSRVGICDLIRCLKKFVAVENLECDFSDFDFANF